MTIDFKPLKAAGVIMLLALTGCTSAQTTSSIGKESTAKITVPAKKVYTYSAADRECLKRVMYFESHRSSRDGLMAVGSVVMNRLTSGAYGDTICDVVSQPRQFAPGVMSRKVHEKAVPELEAAADAILRGERNPEVKEAMFFHQDGLKFPYGNMHYVTVAGGNAFYEKRSESGELQTPPPKSADEYMLSFAPHMSSAPGLIAVSDATSGAAATQVAQADSGVTPVMFTLPDDIPLPLDRPQIASLASSGIAATEIWSAPASAKKR